MNSDRQKNMDFVRHVYTSEVCIYIYISFQNVRYINFGMPLASGFQKHTKMQRPIKNDVSGGEVRTDSMTKKKKKRRIDIENDATLSKEAKDKREKKRVVFSHDDKREKEEEDDKREVVVTEPEIRECSENSEGEDDGEDEANEMASVNKLQIKKVIQKNKRLSKQKERQILKHNEAMRKLEEKALAVIEKKKEKELERQKDRAEKKEQCKKKREEQMKMCEKLQQHVSVEFTRPVQYCEEIIRAFEELKQQKVK